MKIYKTERSVDELIQKNEYSFLLQMIPNNMGINLCSVKSIEWHKLEDGQLTNLIINFIPYIKPNATIKEYSNFIETEINND